MPDFQQVTVLCTANENANDAMRYCPTHHYTSPTQTPAEIKLEVKADAEPEKQGRNETLDMANEELDEGHLGLDRDERSSEGLLLGY